MKKDRGKPVYSINSRIDYSTFINSNEIKRKELIYRVLLKSMAKLKDKGINNIEVVEDFIEAQISAGV